MKPNNPRIVQAQIIATFFEGGQAEIKFGGTRHLTENEFLVLSDWLEQQAWPQMQEKSGVQ